MKIGFIGMTLEDTDTLVAQSGIQGWNFQDEAETANALVPELKRQGVEAIVVLLHEGGIADPASGRLSTAAPASPARSWTSTKALDPEIDAVITGHTHLPYNCTHADPAGSRAWSRARSRSAASSPRSNLVLDKRTRRRAPRPQSRR